MIGLAPTPDEMPLQAPRVAVVAAPALFRSLDGTVHQPAGFDLAARMLSMGRPHRAIMGTGALNIGVAAGIEGTIPFALARRDRTSPEIRVGNPSGVVVVGAQVCQEGGVWTVRSAAVYRTARRLMRGEVAVPWPLAGLPARPASRPPWGDRR
jgi:2-methylaconitate cis-trans-isomerase PrpF